MRIFCKLHIFLNYNSFFIYTAMVIEIKLEELDDWYTDAIQERFSTHHKVLSKYYILYKRAHPPRRSPT